MCPKKRKRKSAKDERAFQISKRYLFSSNRNRIPIGSVSNSSKRREIKRREIKRPPFCKGWPLFKNISAARSFAGLMAIQSSFLFSLMRRYFLELSLSTTGHLFSPWKRLLQNHCRYCRICAHTTQRKHDRQ